VTEASSAGPARCVFRLGVGPLVDGRGRRLFEGHAADDPARPPGLPDEPQAFVGAIRMAALREQVVLTVGPVGAMFAG
jgi:hypothetical protein